MHNPLSQGHANPGDGASVLWALVRLTEAHRGAPRLNNPARLSAAVQMTFQRHNFAVVAVGFALTALRWCYVYVSIHPKFGGEDSICRLWNLNFSRASGGYTAIQVENPKVHGKR